MNEPHNHYAPPTSRVADPSSGGGKGGPFIPNGRRVPLGRGVYWISESGRMFFRQPAKWIGVLAISILLMLLPGFFPFLNVLGSVLVAFIFAGVALLADSQRRTNDFVMGDLFKGFNLAPRELAIVGVVMTLNSLVMFAVYTFYVGVDTALAIVFGYGEAAANTFQLADVWKGVFMSMVLAIPLYCVTYAAPQLVVLHGQSATTAMKHSFSGLMRNLPAGIIYAVMMSALVVISALPLFIGLFITIPMYIIGTYVAYRDIFVGDEPL